MTSLWLIPVTVGLTLYALMFLWNTSAVLIAFYRFYLRKLRRIESMKSNGSVSLANTPDGANTKRKGISILRPLKGIDENLYENLNSFMELVAGSAKEQSQSKIDMEMILCLQQNDKDLLRLNNEIVKKLVSYHNLQEIEVSSSPTAAASSPTTQTLNYSHTENCYGLSSSGKPLLRVVTSSVDVGVNPKINNILVGYLKAAHDLVWIVDSNVINYYKDTQIIEEYLSQLSATKGGIGLIHHAPIGTDSCSLGALMEELFLNTSHLKAYLVFNTVEIDSCVIGKSLIFSRKELESYHQASSPIDSPEKGLQSFAKFIAEDNMIGQAFLSLGYKHYLSPFVAEQRLGKMKVMDYWMRRIRWTRIRAYSLPLAVTLLEPFIESVLNGVMGYFCISVFYPISLMFFIYHFVYWFACDVLALYLVDQNYDFRPSFIVGWVLRELSAMPIYLMATFGNGIVWRGETYVLRMGGACMKGQMDSTFWRDCIFEGYNYLASIIKGKENQAIKLK